MIRSALSNSVMLHTAAPADVDTDLLIVPHLEGENLLQAVQGLSQATAGAVDKAIGAREIQGKPYELFLTPVVSGWRAARIAIVGAGRAADFDLERLRRVATAGAMAAKQRRVARIAFLHRPSPDSRFDAAAAAQAIVEGLVLATFNADRYKSQDRGGPPPERMTVVVPPSAESNNQV